MNIKESTLSYDNCIGCGVCASVCPKRAISMHITIEIIYSPIINDSICINCGLCAKYCPQSHDALVYMNQRVSEEKDYNLFGLDNVKGYLTWMSGKSAERSASGGIATEIEKAMLKEGLIEAVIHAVPVAGVFNVPPYRGALSTSVEEIEERRGSFYAAIDFSNALEMIENSPNIHRVLAVGTPCITRAMKPLLLNNKKYGVEVCYTMSLACSHNVNGMLAAYLADSFKISRNQRWSINYRDKGVDEGIPDASNFNTAYFDENGKVLARHNRFKSQWTDLWRNYAFSMNCCNSCSDFWGADSDITVKDAWYKWNYDKESKSIILIRNDKIHNLFLTLEANRELLDIATIVECQKTTVEYKHGGALKRHKIGDDVSKWNLIDRDHKFKSYVSAKSTAAYKKMLKDGYSNSFYYWLKACLLLKKYNPVTLSTKVLRKAIKIMKRYKMMRINENIGRKD